MQGGNLKHITYPVLNINNANNINAYRHLHAAPRSCWAGLRTAGAGAGVVRRPRRRRVPALQIVPRVGSRGARPLFLERHQALGEEVLHAATAAIRLALAVPRPSVPPADAELQLARYLVEPHERGARLGICKLLVSKNGKTSLWSNDLPAPSPCAPWPGTMIEHLGWLGRQAARHLGAGAGRYEGGSAQKVIFLHWKNWI